RDWWTGNAYERLGFEIASYTQPQKFYINPHTMKRLDHSISQQASEQNFDTLDSLELANDLVAMQNSGSVKLIKIVQKEPIIILGPTASGKSSFAVQLAKKIG